MTLPNLQEPSTKFFGPQIGYFTPPPLSRILLTLHNLEHGDLWNPAFETELLTPQLLAPLATLTTWRVSTTNFIWTYHHRQHWEQLPARWIPPREEIIVVRPGSSTGTFNFFPKLAVHLWARNANRTATDNVAFNGTCTFSYLEA
jgi:hypothetical protein